LNSEGRPSSSDSSELTQAKNPEFLATLAAALAEQGDFAQAVKGQLKAMALAPESQQPDFRKALELYCARKPFRD
jgi:Flp pilus assembly protein TadD